MASRFLGDREVVGTVKVGDEIVVTFRPAKPGDKRPTRKMLLADYVRQVRYVGGGGSRRTGK